MGQIEPCQSASGGWPAAGYNLLAASVFCSGWIMLVTKSAVCLASADIVRTA